MDVSKLKEGMELKNYSELSLLLGDKKPKTGKSRMLQLENLKSFVDYRKEGNKFIVEKVFNKNEVIAKEVQKGRKSLYSKMIEVLIMDSFPKDKKVLIVSKSKLTSLLGMINNNYTMGYKEQFQLANNLNMDIAYVNDFYSINESNLNRIIDTALNAMVNKTIIFKSEVIMVKPKGSYLKEADDMTVNTIIEIESEVKYKHNLKSNTNLNYILSNPNYFKVKETRDELLSERTNIEYYYRAIKLNINTKYLEKEKIELTDFILSEIERLDELERLNSTYSKNLIINAEKRHKLSIGTESIRADTLYVDHFKTLVHNLINPNASEIEFQGDKVAFNPAISTFLPF